MVFNGQSPIYVTKLSISYVYSMFRGRIFVQILGSIFKKLSERISLFSGFKGMCEFLKT